MAIYDLSLALASEHSLKLLEDVLELHLGGLEDAELPGSWLAPVNSSLWESFVSESVLADSNEVVSFNSYVSTQ